MPTDNPGDLKHTERLAFEPFGGLDGVLTGAPLKVFPEGLWYRDNRKLNVTPDRLREFATNVKAGLPRFDIPINIEHNGELGRYGSVNDLEYFENGPQGAGLYATKYELTAEGRKLVEQEKFIGLSGEAVWTLFDDAKYQDPKTGDKFDNVLVGLALTNKPFFGKEVNLYSADPAGASESVDAYVDRFRQFTSKQRKTLAKKGLAMPKGNYPIANTSDLKNAIQAIGRAKNPVKTKAFIKKRAAALGATSQLPQNWSDSDMTKPTDEFAAGGATATGGKGPSGVIPAAVPKGGKMGSAYKKLRKAAKYMKAAISDSEPGPNQNILAGQTTATAVSDQAAPQDVSLQDGGTGPAAGDRKNKKKGTGDAVDWHTQGNDGKSDNFTISRKEYEKFKEKAELAEALAVRVKAVENERRLERLTIRCEQFTALPVAANELAEKFAALQDRDSELFKYFEGLIETMDRQVAQGALFSQVGTQRTGSGAPDTFGGLADRILADKYKGDMGKYVDAMSDARKQRPDLFAAQYPHQAQAHQSGRAQS